MGTITKKVSIEIEGDDYEKKYNFLNIVLDQQLLRPNELTFKMQRKVFAGDSMADSKFDVPRKLMGAKVKLSIEAVRFDDTNESLLEFQGIIFKVNISHRSDMQTEQLIDVRACSPDYLLINHPHCISFENVSLKDIVDKTILGYNKPNKIDPHTTGNIPYTVQYNETNYQFLTRLARRYGEWMYYDGEKWIFGKIIKKDKVKLDPRHHILDYNFQAELSGFSTTLGQHDYMENETTHDFTWSYPELTEPGYHRLTDEAMEKSSTLFNYTAFQNMQCGSSEEKDFDEIEAVAKAQFFGEKTGRVVCTGSTVRADLTIGSVIEIIDHLHQNSKDYSDIVHDELIIAGITHTTETDGNYSNTFTAYPAKSEYPPYFPGDVFPRATDQRAIVMDNQDPEKLGRIRVQFLWQEEHDPDMMTPWIRIAQPHGGDGKGFYFIPEIDEEVMVGFDNGNAERPYVIGTLWHGKALPGSKWPNDTNDIKAIRTRNGHTIEIHDKGKGGKIKIYDHEKNNYVLTFSTDEKLIKLESSGNIELRAKKDILLAADGEIGIFAGSSSDMQSEDNTAGRITMCSDEDIQMTVFNDFYMNVENNYERHIKGKQECNVFKNKKEKIEGDVDIEAKSNMNVTVTEKVTTTSKNHDHTVTNMLNLFAKDVIEKTEFIHMETSLGQAIISKEFLHINSASIEIN